MYGKQQAPSCFWLPQGQVDSGLKVFAGGIFDLFSVCCAAIFAAAKSSVLGFGHGSIFVCKVNYMTQFDDIRPYHDAEVRPTIDRILADPELVDAVARLKFPKLTQWLGWLIKPLVKKKLSDQLAGVNNVRGFQEVVERYMTGMIAEATTAVTISGQSSRYCDGSCIC
jgi:hypothetical protein